MIVVYGIWKSCYYVLEHSLVCVRITGHNLNARHFVPLDLTINVDVEHESKEKVKLSMHAC